MSWRDTTLAGAESANSTVAVAAAPSNRGELLNT